MTTQRTHAGQVEKSCPVCGMTYFTWPSELARGSGGTCSQACYHKGRVKSERDRFWEKVDKEGSAPVHCPELGPCWLWTAATKGGKWDYGVLGGPIPGESLKLAHRVSWELHHGAIPEGAKVLHRCDNPRCVNPAHLFLGTLSDNTQDMLSKGRHNLPHGEDRPFAKLTWEIVRRMRTRYAAGGVTMRELAEENGVSSQTVFSIIRNRKWQEPKG